MARYISNFPPGPLDKYRKSSSFNWKEMKQFLDTEEVLEFENRFIKELQKYKEFTESNTETPVLDKIRYNTMKKVFIMKFKLEPFFLEAYTDPLKLMSIVSNYYPLDASTVLKYGLTFQLFPSVIQTMGSERHNNYVEDSLNGDILGCFCLTEIAHGSNVKGLKTTATYNNTSQEFILHTPDFTAAKCLIGLLGQSATHGTVFAQLITPNGQNHGIHAFLVNIRDPKTMLPYPGITVCDMGEKIGLNGIDNGILMFNHYRIPRENLLNKIGDITEDGQYTTTYKDSNKEQNATLGAFLHGRLFIVIISTSYIVRAITIAVRYAAVRKQFSADVEGEEIPILEYQSHQYRLLPYLALTYAAKLLCKHLCKLYSDLLLIAFSRDKTEDLTNMALEIHAIASACKPVVSWVVQDGIQECREACGGHGYLKASGLGELRNINDPNCTYEGENHVLIQQTSNWLFKLWPLVLKHQFIAAPYGSVSFLNDAEQILKQTFNATSVEETIKPNTIVSAFQWLVCYLLKSSYERYEELVKSATNSDTSNKTFWAKNESQIFFAKNLAIVYIQNFILQVMYKSISDTDNCQTRNVLMKLFSLYGIWSLEKHIPILYKGGYATGSNAVTLIQNSVLKLCEDLKDDSVALVDAVAQPDFIINSVLGYSDGKVYEHLEKSIRDQAGAFSRPKWWQEIVSEMENFKAKL